MSIQWDPRPLADWVIGDTTQTYTRRDTSFYALSIGVGHDALDRTAYDFVDPWSPRLVALPTMALVLGYPGFWLGCEDVFAATGVRSADVLHVEQSIEWLSAVPVEGHVVGETRVTGLAERGDGRGWLLRSERGIRAVGRAEPFAFCRQVHLLRPPEQRDTTQTRPSKASATHDAPADAAVVTAIATTRPEQALLYRLNGDANAIHFDPAAAADAGLQRPILHGMATIGIAGKAVLDHLCASSPARLRALSMRLTRPVHPGETLRTRMAADGHLDVAVVERNGVGVALGHAKVAQLDEERHAAA